MPLEVENQIKVSPPDRSQEWQKRAQPLGSVVNEDLVQSWMIVEQRSSCGFDCPCNAASRVSPANTGQKREGSGHIPNGAEQDNQDALRNSRESEYWHGRELMHDRVKIILGSES